MERLIKAQDVQRTAFERLCNETTQLVHDGQDIFIIQGNIKSLESRFETLNNMHKKIVDLMLDTNLSEDDIDNEISIADKLSNNFQALKFRVDHLLMKDAESQNRSSVSRSSSSRHKVKLPVIELKKFGGEIADWLPFWSQFKRIHEDEELANEDKFQYLLQSTIPNSRARLIVESYPPTNKNYDKVIESLKSRFGRDDLLIEVYVRELLKLIFKNLNGNLKLSILYDKLEAHLRSLETLGVTTDKCAAMLYPLVESCLSEEILRAWQRNVEFSLEINLKSRLDKLMLYLKKEVEGEERISLAMAGFDLQKAKKKDISDFTSFSTNTPTAAGLINRSTPKCVFCKQEHFSTDCKEALILPFDEKKKILSQNGCCHLCLKFGHISRRCRSVSKLKCDKCQGKHATVMCFKKPESNIEILPVRKPEVENLSNQTYQKRIFLQTLLVKIKNDTRVKLVRAIIDTGSQRSYICKHTAREMGYEPVREEEMVHALFGGYKSDAVIHKCYKINVKSLDSRYECTFEALDQTVICGNINCISEGPWLGEVKRSEYHPFRYT